MIKPGQRYEDSYGNTVEIIREHIDGWVCYNEGDNSYRWYSPRVIGTMFTQIVPFFEAGKRYKYTYGLETVYTVRHVETFSDGRMEAAAVTDTDTVILNRLDFEEMIEVQD